MEIINVCFQIHTKHINTLCGKKFCGMKADKESVWRTILQAVTLVQMICHPNIYTQEPSTQDSRNLPYGHVGSSPACHGSYPRSVQGWSVFNLSLGHITPNYVGFPFQFLNYSTGTRACYMSLQVMKHTVITFPASTCYVDSYNYDILPDTFSSLDPHFKLL
jgi:hypothetical protein